MLDETKNIFCPSCRQKQISLYGLDDEGRVKPLSEIKVCINPKCSLYIDIEKVKKSWVKK